MIQKNTFRCLGLYGLILFLFFLLSLPLCSQWINKPPQQNRPASAEQMQEYNNSAVDTNFTFEKYADFLRKVSDKSKYIVVPIGEFKKTVDSGKIVIGLRHDVDNDLLVAQNFSRIEKALGFRSTYYILHTAPYYLRNPEDKSIHNESIIPILKDMQDNSHFEIGWHNDLVTLQVVYNIDPVKFLHQELDWLRKNGIRIIGTSSHGSSYCRVYHYVNYYIFEGCDSLTNPAFQNTKYIPDGPHGPVTIKKAKLSDFGLQYEAYFLNNNKYFSDASITNGIRWNIGMLDLKSLKKGDRVIILLHPIHWHQASREAQVVYFYVPGQSNCRIDNDKQTIHVSFPPGTDRKNVIPYFVLSPGAYVKVAGSMQTAGVSRVNLTQPVRYTVFSENRSITKSWTVVAD